MLDFIRNPDGSMVAGEAAANDEVESLVQEIVDDGIIHEGFQYDPYNIHSTPGGGDGDEEGCNWSIPFQGRMIDTAAELFHFGPRDYDPTIGGWMEANPTPMAYVNGAEIYPTE
jgi:hypothetical protein